LQIALSYHDPYLGLRRRDLDTVIVFFNMFLPLNSRHYYKKNILLQVREKQMVYQFGPEIMKQISQGYKW
jgi:hypothetical protein